MTSISMNPDHQRINLPRPDGAMTSRSQLERGAEPSEQLSTMVDHLSDVVIYRLETPDFFS
jgi:hypothetical protein